MLLADVVIAVTLLGIPFVAKGTFERLLASVHTYVCCQYALLRERLVADVADEALVAR